MKNAVALLVAFGGEEVDKGEFLSLIESASISVKEVITVKRYVPDVSLFIGKGKVAEISRHVIDCGVGIVVTNKNISPSQHRNLERAISCEVLDWTGLILNIFAQRAKSHEGRMQVELAQLQYMATKLRGGWSHLERQRGGFGLRGGPGETQLELDRRLLMGRIKQIKRRLNRISAQRKNSGQHRKRVGMQTVALVGYTNVGKTTIFNQLTKSKGYVADQVFATLDTTIRTLSDGVKEDIVISDTVGFIQGLPTELVAAFKATLEETKDASLLLHVVDLCDDLIQNHMANVDGILKTLGASNIPVIIVYNKIDMRCGEQARISRNQKGEINTIWLSARNDSDISLLASAVRERLNGRKKLYNIIVRLTEHGYKLRSLLYNWKSVVEENPADNSMMILKARLDSRELMVVRGDRSCKKVTECQNVKENSV